MKSTIGYCGVILALTSTTVSAQNWHLAGADKKSKSYVEISSLQKMGEQRVRYWYEVRFEAVQENRSGVRYNVSHMYEEADCDDLSYGLMQVSASLDGKITLEPLVPTVGRLIATPGSVAHSRILEVCRITGLR